MIKNFSSSIIPINLLKETIETLGFPLTKNSGPNKNLDLTTINGMEETLFLVLGENKFKWQEIITIKYKNEILGRKLFHSFLPNLPKNMLLIHGNFIIDALKIYEYKENFSFSCYGTYPAEYNFNENLIKKNNYAFIFNTDNSNNKNNNYQGSHWVCFFIDIINNQIDYFDSLGLIPNKFIIKSILHIINLLKIFFPNITNDLNYTKKRIQFDYFNCGVYVVHFIINRLLGKKFIDILNNEMLVNINDYRNIYWNVIDEPLFEYEAH